MLSTTKTIQTKRTNSDQVWFRMSKIGNALPTRWAYDSESDSMPGAQVLSAHQAAQAALGEDIDGTYSAAEGYTQIVVVLASDSVDAGHSFSAVLPEHVTWTGIIDTDAFTDWLEAQAEAADEDVAEWAVWADEVEIAEWLTANCTETAVAWIDTLNVLA